MAQGIYALTRLRMVDMNQSTRLEQLLLEIEQIMKNNAKLLNAQVDIMLVLHKTKNGMTQHEMKEYFNTVEIQIDDVARFIDFCESQEENLKAAHGIMKCHGELTMAYVKSFEKSRDSDE